MKTKTLNWEKDHIDTSKKNKSIRCDPGDSYRRTLLVLIIVVCLHDIAYVTENRCLVNFMDCCNQISEASLMIHHQIVSLSPLKILVSVIACLCE